MNSLRNKMENFAPALFAISILLVVVGTVAVGYFVYIAFILLVTPEKSEFMTYVLSQLPQPTDPMNSFSWVADGKSYEINVPSNFLSYIRFIFAFLIWGMIGNFAATLIVSGMTIFKSLMSITNSTKLNQKEAQNADTRNSNNSR